ncbi:lipopolysaccharide biosynthesis protein [Olivibacter sp. XZL3]|uniref:lipopolysaccharide biosynthesis protein n=1 Tax=Olivibacter sp. XZL3 TaxID=1735116 RepID=UPI001064F412|nr:lipopolysaccharide biosynthesis protein [Olivibacter sp. XZL3]
MEQDQANHQITLNELTNKVGEIAHYLKSRYKIIIAAFVIGCVAGLAYSLLKDKEYKAELSFVLADNGGSGGGLSAYAGIASQFGIDLGGIGESNGLFKGDNILEFIKSRRIISEALLSDVTINGKSELLANRYAEAAGFRRDWDKEPETKSFYFRKDQHGLQDSLIQVLYLHILKKALVVAKPDKKLNIIKVTTRSTDELFAKAFTDELIHNVMTFYVNTKTKKEQENLDILTHQVDSVRKKLYDALGGAAEANDNNPNPNQARQKLQVLSQRKRVDAQVNGKILEELVKNQELARISLRKEMPIIQVIDAPLLPLQNNAIGPIKGAVLGALLFTFLTIAFFMLKVLLRSMNSSHD